jgi:hypothetical protein
MQQIKTYESNPLLRAAGQKIALTAQQFAEIQRCAEDFEYFAENYCKILSLDHGLVNFKLRGYQKRVASNVVDNRFNIVMWCRQSGKTTLVAALLCWEVLFRRGWIVAILANKGDQSQEIVGRVQTMYENLPFWMQKGVKTWNKRSFTLENNSRIFSAATSASGIRGRSVNHLYLDEFAHIDANKQEPFYTSTYPVISSGKETKITITSTPKGLEMFYKLWQDATTRADGTKIDPMTNVGEAGTNGFVPSESHWSEVPGRDEAWKEMTLAQMNGDVDKFNQEYENHFIGSSGTLISGSVLRRLVHIKPLYESGSLRVFKEPVKDHIYSMLVDTSRGLGLDYNTFVIIDCSKIPYEVVCTFRSNTVSTLQFPNFIADAAKRYNNAMVLVETNDSGLGIADALHFDLDVENVLMTTTNGKKGQTISAGFGGNVRRGLKTSKATKSIGCTQLKNLIELDKLVINDFHILQELFTFVEKGASYSAEDGKHDDLVMPLVLFGWLAQQRYFKDLTNMDIRAHVVQESEYLIEQELMPFGFIRDPVDEMDQMSHRERLFGQGAPEFF